MGCGCIPGRLPPRHGRLVVGRAWFIHLARGDYTPPRRAVARGRGGWGYAVVWAIMLSTALGMVLYFKRKNWW